MNDTTPATTVRPPVPHTLRSKTTAYILTIVVTVLAAIPSTTAYSAEAKQAPHIVLILADDMGYGDPECYNEQSQCLTPHLNRLAKEGIRFTDGHAAGGVCHPSRYGMLTGRYPFRHDRRWTREAMILESTETVPSLLKRAGYQTRMVGKWHLGFENGADYEWQKPLRGGPVDRGFDSLYGMPASLDIPPYFYIEDRRVVQPPTIPIEANSSPGWSPIQGKFWRKGLRAGNFIMEEVLDNFSEKAVETIRNDFTSNAEPQFLYLALPAPHTPWLPAEKFKGRGDAGLYGEFVAHVDAVVGRLLKALDDTGAAENTLVIFSSDNGPVWYEEDVERFGHDSTHPFRGMKGDAWEGGHRVPLIMRWPGQIPAWSECDETVGFIDFLPTLADILDLPLQDPDRVDGQSFAALLDVKDSEAWPRGKRVMLQHHTGSVIRSGPWKLITHLGSGGFSKPRRIKPEKGGPEGQLYHMGYDKGEQDNLWLERPELVDELIKKHQKILNEQ